MAYIDRAGCNSFKVITKKPAYPYNQFPQTITSMTSGITISSVSENDTHFIILAEYTKDISSQLIVLGYSPGVPLAIAYNPTMPALYYTADECQTVEEVNNLFIAT